MERDVNEISNEVVLEGAAAGETGPQAGPETVDTVVPLEENANSAGGCTIVDEPRQLERSVENGAAEAVGNDTAALNQSSEAVGDANQSSEAVGDVNQSSEAVGDVNQSSEAVGDVNQSSEAVNHPQAVGDEDPQSVADEAHSEGELQEWVAMKEEEVEKMAAQLAEVEASQQQQAEEFTAEIELLKSQHSAEIERALAGSVGVQEQFRNLEIQHNEQMERALSESEEKHKEELQTLRIELENSNSAEGSLIPQLGPQLSPRAQKELRLQRERLQRQHSSELKSQERALRSELTLENEGLQSRLEEEFTAKLAEAVTESALKNAAQVEEISVQLRQERQSAVAQLEEEQEERRRQEVARLAEERREALETCRREFESARSEYESRISALEAVLASEREKQGVGREEGEWVEREERIRVELESECRQRVEETMEECATEKEAALSRLREALEDRLQEELRNAHELHKQELIEHWTQLQAVFEEKLSSAQEKVDSLQRELQRLGQQQEVMVREAVKQGVSECDEVSEKLQAVHRAELVAVETEREAERGRHQEEMERLREELETRLHQELEQVSGGALVIIQHTTSRHTHTHTHTHKLYVCVQLTESHKAEVGHLQQQYQAQLDSTTLSHQQTLAEVYTPTLY